MYVRIPYTELAPCIVLTLQSPHKKQVPITKPTDADITMCKCKGMIRLFIVRIAYPDAHYTFIAGVNKVIAPQSVTTRACRA